MTRVDPVWVTVKLARAGQTHEVRVSLDKSECLRALASSVSDQQALCIQVRTALRKKIPAAKRTHLRSDWPGFVEFAEIRVFIASALKKLSESADFDAREEMLEEEHNRTFLPNGDVLFDH